jgi:hydroxypyruvate isomerase
MKAENTDRVGLNQSIAYWCFEPHWSLEETCRIACRLGCKSVELVDPKQWPLLKDHGLICALTLSHWFDQGMNHPSHHAMCIEKIRSAIQSCAEFGFPNVLTFTGFRGDLSDEEGIENCVKGFNQVIGLAEKNEVNLCLEMLNSRVEEEMKGHPGYQGDRIRYCVEIIKRVDSPRMKLLFDIYHVQIMEGDIIRRIRKYKDYIGHYHLAGNPGRHEPDDSQEINFRPILDAIRETGYTGFLGHEFLPAGDPLEGLRNAVALCEP